MLPMNYKYIFIICGPNSFSLRNSISLDPRCLYLFTETGGVDALTSYSSNCFSVLNCDPGDFVSFFPKAVNLRRLTVNSRIPRCLSGVTSDYVVRIRSDASLFDESKGPLLDLASFLPKSNDASTNTVVLTRKGSRKSYLWRNSIPFCSDLFVMTEFCQYDYLFHSVLPALLDIPFSSFLCSEELFGFALIFLRCKYKSRLSFLSLHPFIPRRFVPSLFRQPRSFLAYLFYDRFH